MYLNLTTKERQRYSLGRLYRAMIRGEVRLLAPFELECHQAAVKAANVEPQRGGIFVPDDVLYGRRDMTVGEASAGGYLKGTAVAPFAAALREVSWVEKVPVQRMEGLRDDLSIPRHASNLTTTWLNSENAVVSEQNPSFGAVGFAPKYVAVIVERSHQHMTQAAPHDAALERELGLSVGAAIATACAQGTGTSGQPLGALDQVAQSVSGTSLTWTNTCELVRLVEAAAAGESVMALVGTGAAKIFRTREKASGSGFILADGKIGDVLALVTAAMPADAVLVGNFSQAVYASWAPLEIVATPLASAANFSRGIVAIRALASLDFGIVHAAAFAKSVSIT